MPTRSACWSCEREFSASRNNSSREAPAKAARATLAPHDCSSALFPQSLMPMVVVSSSSTASVGWPTAWRRSSLWRYLCITRPIGKEKKKPKNQSLRGNRGERKAVGESHVETSTAVLPRVNPRDEVDLHGSQ